MFKIIVVGLCLALTAPAYADSFTKPGNFMGGALAGALTGANLTKPAAKDATARVACHVGMATAMFLVIPGGGWLYLGVSALISGIARTKTGEYPPTPVVKVK